MVRGWIVYICIILSFGMTGCNRGAETSGNDTPTVAFVMKSLNNPFFIKMEEGAKKVADELGIDLIVQAAEREVDVERQMQIVENLIQRRVDAICLTPSGAKEVIPAIAKANEAGIPVLIVDSGIDEEAARLAGVETVTFIGSDNYEGGRMAAEYFGKHFNEPVDAAILEGVPGHETGDMRLNGFMDAVNKIDHINVVATQPANFERDRGYNVFQNMLQTYPDIKALFAANDMMALGAIEAIDAAGESGEIAVIGFDAVDEARKAIAEGRMMASVAQNPFSMGEIAVQTADKVLKGETVASKIPVTIELITQ